MTAYDFLMGMLATATGMLVCGAIAVWFAERRERGGDE